MLTPEQIQNRKKGIGASEAAAVLGVCPFYTPYELWLVKTGKMESKQILTDSQLRLRHLHEETIAKEYEALAGVNVHTVPETLYHKDYPFILCHLDRKIEGQDKILECKSAFSFLSYMWGPSGSDEVPLNYIVQVQTQLAITGYQEADLAVLLGTDDFRIYHFKRDEALIATIIDAIKKFWHCVETNTSPELTNKHDVALAYPRPSDAYKEADEQIIETVGKIREIKAKSKELENERSKLEDVLTIFLKDAEGVKTTDGVLATWKANKNGVRSLRIVEAKH